MSSSIRSFKRIFGSKPILQFPDPNKDYILYTNASNNAYSSVLCQPQDNKNDILADAISRLCTIDIYKDPAEVKLEHSPVPTSQPESSKTMD